MADLVIRIAGNSKELQNEYNRIKGQTKDLEKGLAKTAKVSAAAFAALTTTVGLTVNEFAKFDNQIRGVRTLLDDASFGAEGLEKGFEKMRTDLLALGASAPLELGSLNQALFDTVSAGVDASSAVETVGVAAKLAVAGLTDVSIATDGVTSALNAYGLEASEAESVAAKFFQAQKAGKTTVEQLASGFGLVASSAANTGVSLDELLAAVSAVTLGGVRTKQAYTSLAQVIANISKPTEEAKATAKALGLEFSIAGLQSKGFAQFMKELTEATRGNTQAQLDLFGSVEATRVVLSLAGNQADDFTRILGDLENSEKSLATFNEAFAVQNASLQNQFKTISNQVKVLAIQFGQQLAPTVSKILKVFSELLTFIQENPALLEFGKDAAVAGIKLTGLVTVLATGALAFTKLVTVMRLATLVVGNLGVGFQVLAGATGIGLLVFAITGLVSEWDESVAAIKKATEVFFRDISELAGKISDVIVGAFTLDPEKFAGGLRGVKEIVLSAIEEINLAIAEATPPDAFRQQLTEEQAQTVLDIKRQARETDASEEEEANQRALERAREKAEREKEAEEARSQAALERRDAFLRSQLEQTEAFNALSEEQQDAFLQRNEQALAKSFKNQQKLRDEVIKDQLAAQQDAQKKRLDSESKFGAALTSIDSAVNSKRLQAAEQTSGQLVKLTKSENETLKSIGKAAAISSIVINTAQSSVEIWKGVMQAIPFFPVALPIAIAAVGANVAFGAEQISKVVTAQQGGVIPEDFGIPGVDSVPALLTPGEFVVPRQNFEETVSALADRRAADRAQTPEVDPLDSTQRIEIGFDGEEASNVITARQIENDALGTSLEEGA